MQNKKKTAVLTGGIVMAAFVLMLSGCHQKNVLQETETENRPIAVVGCDDYTPFSYTDQNGRLSGIDVELATEAFQRMGYWAEENEE